jgi:hypothetical protein
MTSPSIDRSQRTAARIVGWMYLLAIPPAVFSQFYVPSRLFVYGNAGATAHNIISHERLFRLGIASNLLDFAIDAVLITALYIVLRRVNNSLAVLASVWRVIETSILVAVVTISDFETLRVLSNADYLRVIDAGHLQAFARLAIGGHNSGYNVGLLFAGLGSTVFCWLWFKSGYIPRALAALGVVASLLLATSTFAFIIFPDLPKLVTVGYYGGPIFLFELTMGFWLLFKGIKPGAPAILT